MIYRAWAFLGLLLLTSGCQQSNDASKTADVIRDGEHIPDPELQARAEAYLANIGFSEGFVEELNRVPGTFDKTRHCVQLFSTYELPDVLPHYKLEISSAGPCPSSGPMPATPRNIVLWVGHSRILDWAYGDVTLGTMDRLVYPPSVAKAKISKEPIEIETLCSRNGYGSSHNCHLVLRQGRICDVVAAGKTSRWPECQ